MTRLEQMVPDFMPGRRVQFVLSPTGKEPILAIVTGALNEGGDWLYRVAWIHDSTRHESWVRSFEIEDES